VNVPFPRTCVAALTSLIVVTLSSCTKKELATEPGVTLGAISETWTPESGVRIAVATSSNTITTSTGYRMYFPLAKTATSTDGLTWTIGNLLLPEGQTFNTAAVRLADGTVMLIYEFGQSMQSPKGARFYRATSASGLVFTKTPGAGANGAVMVPESGDSDFINVPDMIVLPDGRVRMYFVAYGDHMESAISSDDGMSWTREGRLEVTGLPTDRLAVDPDIIRLDDGRYRLYFTAPAKGTTLDNKRVLSATSSDGLRFLLDEGERLGVANNMEDIVDPDVVRLPDGRYRMYYGYRASSAGLYELRSAITQ
jgi:hypothetical protein